MQFDLEVVEGEDPSTDLPKQSPPQTRLQYPMITQVACHDVEKRYYCSSNVSVLGGTAQPLRELCTART